MNRRGVNQYTVHRRSRRVVFFSWFGAVLSTVLLLPSGAMVTATAASLRPCSINNAGLTMSSCGKSSADVTDLLLIAIFAGCLLIVVSAFTHALRMTRRTA